MKYKIWFLLSLLSFNVFGEQSNNTLQKYEQFAEDQLTKDLIAKRPELKDFKIIFNHIYLKTSDKKLDRVVKYDCQFQRSTAQGQCTFITRYLADPDCWACEDPYNKETP